MSLDDFLSASELSGPCWDYIEGKVYRRPDERNLHHGITMQAMASLMRQVRERRFAPITSRSNLRLSPSCIYHADGGITCQPNPSRDVFEDKPTILFEVLSVRSRRLDEVEKRRAYLAIPSLLVYLLIEQDCPLVVVHSRFKESFVVEEHEGMEAVIPLPEIVAHLPLAHIYEDIEFVPEEVEQP